MSQGEEVFTCFCYKIKKKRISFCYAEIRLEMDQTLNVLLNLWGAVLGHPVYSTKYI